MSELDKQNRTINCIISFNICFTLSGQSTLCTSGFIYWWCTRPKLWQLDHCPNTYGIGSRWLYCRMSKNASTGAITQSKQQDVSWLLSSELSGGVILIFPYDEYWSWEHVEIWVKSSLGDTESRIALCLHSVRFRNKCLLFFPQLTLCWLPFQTLSQQMWLIKHYHGPEGNCNTHAHKYQDPLFTPFICRLWVVAFGLLIEKDVQCGCIAERTHTVCVSACAFISRLNIF